VGSCRAARSSSYHLPCLSAAATPARSAKKGPGEEAGAYSEGLDPDFTERASVFFNKAQLPDVIPLFDRARRVLLGGGPVLAAQCCGNLGDAILKLTVGIAERLRRWHRRQFVRLVLFWPAP
jgi:hypothetical protein